VVQKIRKKIVAGNWKMNKSLAEARDLAGGIKRELENVIDVDVVLCPPFTVLRAVGEMVSDTPIRIGAQNMHWENSGAFTGEISPSMLRDLYCWYVILGHSERRTLFHETDEMVNKKVKAALASHLVPIMCVGETLQERQGGQMKDVVKRQVEQGLAGVGADLRKVVVAYEPVWAIGTGVNATPEQAQEMHAFIRDVLKGVGGADVAGSIRIQYGGSMKPANARDLMSQPDIDGGLIGGASLDARSFADIVRAAG